MKEGRKLKEEIQRGMMTQHGDIKKIPEDGQAGAEKGGEG